MYDFKKIEEKWQKIWEEKECFKASNNSEKPFPSYLLFIFKKSYLSCKKGMYNND